jgi:hypothetical protein
MSTTANLASQGAGYDTERFNRCCKVLEAIPGGKTLDVTVYSDSNSSRSLDYRGDFNWV